MSNKFLNPSGETDLSDVIARVNSNTEAIQDHVADLANPHITSTDNIDGNNSPPLNSDDVVEGATNKYLVQPFNTQFDMGGNDIINVSTLANDGQIALSNTTLPPGTGSVLVLDPTAAPTIGPVLQSGTGKDINIISDADCDIKNANAGDNVRLFGDGIQLKDQAGTNYLTLDATDITSFKDLNMNANDITNVGNLLGQGVLTTLNIGTSTVSEGIDIKGNGIDIRAGTAPIELQTSDVDIRLGRASGQAGTLRCNMSGGLDMNQNLLQNVAGVINAVAPTGVIGTLTSIGESTTNMSMAFTTNSASINQLATNIASFTPTLNTSFQDLSMDGNDITNVGNVALTSINTNIIYVPDGTMPSSFDADRTYIFEGTRTTATPIVLPAGPITLKGMSRENSTIVYTGSGALFTGTDQNLTIVDLGWSCTNTAGYFLDATNAAKDKLLTIQNCEFREAYQVMRLEGYDLVDFQNNVITYIRSGALLPAYGMTCINVSKLEINSCEFIRWYEFGQPANTNAFIGNMIDISGSNGASQITNNIIHPRVAQNGIDIDGSATFGAGVNITGNTFVDAGLTGGAVLETNSNADYDEKGITEANTLLPNLKSRVGAQLSAANTITTATSGTPADINLNNLLVAFDEFGVTVGSGGGVTYNRTRPVNFQVTFVANLVANTGGANQRVGLTVSKNGVNTGINSFVNLDSAGTAPKSVTLTIVGSAVQGDVFRSQLVNTSTSSNITCTDLIVSGIEL
jgi:hypothetical protein